MSNDELITKLKYLVFDENKDEIADREQAFRFGLYLDNEELYDTISNIINFYKPQSTYED
tara:strand:- start:1489 stop:1668 length:180 start_codon:yes stop_codon:yes gene_type:complete